MNGTGQIILNIEGISAQETERYRKILSILLISGGLAIKNGKTILHFDHIGKFRRLQFDFFSWSDNEAELPLEKNLNFDIIKKADVMQHHV